jgi:hypothetical protein
MMVWKTTWKADVYIGGIAKPSRKKASSSSSKKKLPTYSPPLAWHFQKSTTGVLFLTKKEKTLTDEIKHIVLVSSTNQSALS